MASGFHQIPVHEEPVEKIACIRPEGQYEYLSMPFGLKTGPSVYQRTIVKSLSSLVNTHAVVYIDDVMIYSKRISEGLEN